jgi:mono/diheme cytochrome c family protein
MRVRRLSFLMAALVWCGAVALAAQQGTSRSVNIGVYTEAQAARGEAVYKSQCASCHYQNEFSGEDFLKRWADKPLWELWDMISSNMPEDQPGTLPDQQYADVISFFLKLNKFPTGGAELEGTTETMKDTLMERPH